MKINHLKLEDLKINDFNKLTNKKDRKVYEFDNIIYKIWSEKWEFRNMCELGILENIYNSNNIPNFIGLIRDNNQINRGYAYKKFENNQIFYRYTSNLTNPINYLLFKLNINFFLKTNNKHLLALLADLFKSFKNSKYLFIALSKESIWHDKTGYHLFDLDSIRSKDWIFCKDKNDREYNRKKENLRLFNFKLSELLKIHNLKLPYFINDEYELNNFYDDFKTINKL